MLEGHDDWIENSVLILNFLTAKAKRKTQLNVQLLEKTLAQQRKFFQTEFLE